MGSPYGIGSIAEGEPVGSPYGIGLIAAGDPVGSPYSFRHCGRRDGAGLFVAESPLKLGDNQLVHFEEGSGHALDGG